MAVVYKLYQPLWSWQYKFYRSTCLLKQIINTRKTIPLNAVISQNVDICNRIVNENILDTEWQSIRETFLQLERITPAIVDSTIMDVCLNKFHLDNAISYFKFLRENNYSLNVGIIGKYLRLYSLKRDSLTDTDKAEIVKTYNVLREKYPYLDSITAEHCIVSLCLTDQWERALELIEMMKLTTSPGITAYSALASAAFKNKRLDIAWKAMSAIALRNMIPQNIAYESYLTYCEQEGAETFSSRIEEMFKFWSEYNIVPQHNIIHMYATTATKYGWSTASTIMSKM